MKRYFCNRCKEEIPNEIIDDVVQSDLSQVYIRPTFKERVANPYNTPDEVDVCPKCKAELLAWLKGGKGVTDSIHRNIIKRVQSFFNCNLDPNPCCTAEASIVIVAISEELERMTERIEKLEKKGEEV